MKGFGCERDFLFRAFLKGIIAIENLCEKISFCSSAILLGDVFAVLFCGMLCLFYFV